MHHTCISDCHQVLLASKRDQLTAATARIAELEHQLGKAIKQGAEAAQRLASVKANADVAIRAQAEASVGRQEALASLQVSVQTVSGYCWDPAWCAWFANCAYLVAA